MEAAEDSAQSLATRASRNVTGHVHIRVPVQHFAAYPATGCLVTSLATRCFLVGIFAQVCVGNYVHKIASSALLVRPRIRHRCSFYVGITTT